MPCKNVVILGSTGSIGRNALEVIGHHRERFAVTALSTHRSVDLLVRQVEAFAPRYVAVTDPQTQARARAKLAGRDVTLVDNENALAELAALPQADIVLDAVVGAAGMPAALAAVRHGKRLALANKEALVLAGQLVMQAAAENDAQIIPVDSEHSAIFQAIAAGRRGQVRRVIITASGGPFRERSMEQLRQVTCRQALDHPTWSMGPKITIDSATLMNKALEVIEAHWLFDLSADEIDVVVHPESIVHSMVEFADSSVIAQMGLPDMKVPIQYALTWPDRLDGLAETFHPARLGQLTFHEPDTERFPGLTLGYEVVRRGGTSGAVVNAANETAVQAFLDGAMHFPDIVETVQRVLSEANLVDRPSLEDLLAADAWARRRAAELLNAKTT